MWRIVLLCNGCDPNNDDYFLTVVAGAVCFSLGDGVTYPTRTVDNDDDNLLAARQRWMEEGGDEFGPGKNRACWEWVSV